MAIYENRWLIMENPMKMDDLGVPPWLRKYEHRTWGTSPAGKAIHPNSVQFPLHFRALSISNKKRYPKMSKSHRPCLTFFWWPCSPLETTTAMLLFWLCAEVSSYRRSNLSLQTNFCTHHAFPTGLSHTSFGHRSICSHPPCRFRSAGGSRGPCFHTTLWPHEEHCPCRI